MGWLNKAILAVAPRIAVSRMRHQLAAQLLEKESRKYEGAAKGRRTAGWSGVGTSANAETGPALSTLRNNARDLERNNGWAVKGLTGIVSNVVGTGIRCQPKGPKEKAKKASKIWKQWAETTACDFDGRNDLYGIQGLVMQSVARDGEALVRFRWSPVAVNGKSTRFPLQLQVLEADFLDMTRTNGDNSNSVIQGVEVDDQGRVVAYWLYEQHPGESGVSFFKRKKYRSNRVPADEVIRIYRQDRAGQLRGVSWFAPVILSLKDLDEYEDAQLIRQKIAACFAVFVRDSQGIEETTAPNAKALPERVEPGIIEHLPAGKDISFADPPSVEGYDVYTRTILRKIAAGFGLTYEVMTGDYSMTNFSSGRMSWIEMGRNISNWRWRMLIPQLCVPIWDQFVRTAKIAGTDLDGVIAEWTAPRRELVNPKEEIAATVAEIRAGLLSISEAVRERGFDFDDLMAEIAADAEKIDKLGLVLDSDPRRTTQQGQPRDKAAPVSQKDATAAAA